MPELNRFVGAMRAGGARANQFSVSISGRSSAVTNEMEFMCRSAQIPALTMGEISVPYRGRQIFVPGDRTYDAWTVTVYNDSNFSIRDDLERWQNALQDIGNSTKSGDINPYQTATVRQKTKDDRTIREYKLIDIWPTTIDAIDLAFDTNDVIEEFGVTFRFNYMTIIPRSSGRSTRASAAGGQIGTNPGSTSSGSQGSPHAGEKTWDDPDKKGTKITTANTDFIHKGNPHGAQ